MRRMGWWRLLALFVLRLLLFLWSISRNEREQLLPQLRREDGRGGRVNGNSISRHRIGDGHRGGADPELGVHRDARKKQAVMA